MASPGPANPFRTASNCTQHLPVPQPQPVDKTDGSTMDISSQRRRTSRNNLPPVLAVDTDSTSPSPTINGPSPGCSLRRRISPANSRNCHTDNNAAAFASSSIIRPGMMMQRAAEPSAATIPATGTTSAFDASPNNDDDDDANSLEAILEPDDCSVSHQEEEDTGGDMYPNCRNHRVVDTEQETDFLSLCRNATNSFDLANLSSRISLGSASTSSSSTNSSTTALHELSRNKALATAAQFPIPPSRGSTSSRPGNHNHSTVSPMAAVATNSAGLEDRRRSTRSLSHLVLDRANSTASNDSSGTSSSVQTLLTIEAQERFREELRTVVQLLWTAYPPAMMTTDGQGCIPFEEALRDWVLACYRCNNDKNGDTAAAAAPSSNPVLGGSNRDGNGNRSSNSLSSSIWKLKESIVSQWANKNSSRKSNGAYYYPNNNNNASCMSTSTLGSAATRNPPMTTPFTPPPLSRSHQMKSDVELGCNNNSPSVKTTGTPDNDDTYTTILVRKDRVFPRRAVRLSAHALNSVAMLSMLLERMEEEVSAPATTSSTNARSSTRRDRRSMADELQTFTVQDMSASIVHSIAVIPDLMQTILFLEDAEQRKQLLETTLMRRVLICTHSIGNWLTEMLQSHDKQASYLALDYLHLVSDASFVVAEPHDSVPTSVKSLTSRKRLEEADRLRDEFYQEVSRLQDFVPSLLSLSEQHIEEAATTNVVQQVLDRVMSRPFVVMVVFCDAIFLALLIYGFRRAVNGVLLGRDRANVLGHIFIANIATFYFALREIGKAVSLCMITRRVRLYFTVWNWIDLVTTILALASSVAIRSQFSGLRSICAITTGFMWLRVLSYLKGINMQLATFVLAILQIAKDLLWFMVILCIVVVLFSQMLFTMLAPDACSVEEVLRESQECSQPEYYLKVYAIFLGDFGLFERESFTSVFSLVIAVLYTFCASVVLLNVLIAIASDSYEKCLIRSANLFGRARVLMLAELVFFQNLLRRGPSDRVVLSINVFKPTETLVQRSTAGFIVFTTASLVLLISWSIGEFVGSLVIGENFGNVWMSIGSLLVNASIPCGIILSLSSSASDGNGRKWGKEEDIGSNSEWYTRYLRSAMLLVLGSSGGKSHLHRNEHQWQGRLLFLQDKMARISDETVVECKSMIHSLDANIQASEASIKEAFHELKSNLQEASTKHNQTNEQLMKLLLKVLATADDLPYT